MARPVRVNRQRLTFRQAILVRNTGARFISRRKNGTQIFRLKGVDLTYSELRAGAFRQAHHQGLGHEKLSRQFRGL